MASYWISTSAFTCGVDVSLLGIITDTAPILHKFWHSPFWKLRQWLKYHYPEHELVLLKKVVNERKKPAAHRDSVLRPEAGSTGVPSLNFFS